MIHNINQAIDWFLTLSVSMSLMKKTDKYNANNSISIRSSDNINVEFKTGIIIPILIHYYNKEL